MGRSTDQIDENVVAGRTRGRRAVSTVDFICPSSRCREGDCVVARREARDGQWEWVTGNTSNTHVEISLRSPEITLVRYTPQSADVTHLELWCFTGQQLGKQPLCSEWEVNYPPGKQTLATCVDTTQKKDKNKNKASTDSKAQDPNVNSAIALMIDYAKEENLSDCWLCQQMPKSTHAPIFSPIPFSEADYRHYDWNGIADRLESHSDNCYTPTFPREHLQSGKYTGLAGLIVDEVNAKYRPPGINLTTLLRVTYAQMYIKLGFEYRMQLTLTQTNCSQMLKDQVCLPQPFTPAVLVEALLSVAPWIGTREVGEVKVKVLDCGKPLQPKVSRTRNCSHYFPPVMVNELTDVPICFQGAGTSRLMDVGHTSCIRNISVAVRQIPLPERVYMVCGGKAYGCVPYSNIRGTCYLAYLIPMIRRVTSSEVAALYAPLHRHKRSLTTTDKVIGTLLPWYGIYITQQEVTSLSKVLEAHLNASAKAMLAEHKELGEVKNLALQNRMALDLLLAARGGTCAYLNSASSECCVYVSDATASVMDMVHNTEQGLLELHQNHGFSLGDLSGVLGTWGAGLAKFIFGIALVILMVCLLGSCIITMVKYCMRKAAAAACEPSRIVASSLQNDDREWTITEAQWRPPVVSGQ